MRFMDERPTQRQSRMETFRVWYDGLGDGPSFVVTLGLLLLMLSVVGPIAVAVAVALYRILSWFVVGL